MAAGIALLPSSEFVLTAAANEAACDQCGEEHSSTNQVCDFGQIYFSREYSSAFGSNRTANRYELNLEMDGELWLQINVPRTSVSNQEPAVRALPSDGATITLRRTGLLNAGTGLIDPDDTLIPLHGAAAGNVISDNANAFGFSNMNRLLFGNTTPTEYLLAGTYEVLITMIPGVVGADTGEYFFLAEYFNDETADASTAGQPLVPGLTVRGSFIENEGGTPGFAATGQDTNHASHDVYIYELEKPGRLTFYVSGGHVSTHPARMPVQIVSEGTNKFVPHQSIRMQLLSNAGGTRFAPTPQLGVAPVPMAAITEVGNWHRNSTNPQTQILAPSMSYIDLEAGTHYIRLEPTAATSFGTYSMRADFIPFDESINDDVIVGVDDGTGGNPDRADIVAAGTRAGARTVDIHELLPEDRTVHGFLSVNNTLDIYRIELSEPGVVYVDFSRESAASSTATLNQLPVIVPHPGSGSVGAAAIAAPHLRWLDSSGDINTRDAVRQIGMPLADNPEYNDRHVRISGTGDSLGINFSAVTAPIPNTHQSYVGLEAGVYYVEVERRNAVTAHNSADTGKYTLTFEFQAAERTHSIGAPVPMQFEETARGLISTSNAMDSYEYEVDTHGILYLEIYSPVNGGLPPGTVRNSYTHSPGDPINIGILCDVLCGEDCNPQLTCHKCGGTGKSSERTPYYITRDGISFGTTDRLYFNYYAVEPGTYTFDVIQRFQNINNSNTGLYNFVVYFYPTEIDDFEPNNNRALGTTLINQRFNPDIPESDTNLMPLNRPVTTMLSLTDHMDLYRIVIDEPGRVNIDIQRPNIPLTTDPVADIFWHRESGTELIQIRPHATSTTAISAFTSGTYMDLEESGVYYVEVRKRMISTGLANPPMTQSSANSGLYTITANFTPAGTTFGHSTDDTATAHIITPGNSTGFMSHQGWVNRFRYTLPTGGNEITVELSTAGAALAGLNPGDLILTAFGPNGAQLPGGVLTAVTTPVGGVPAIRGTFTDLTPGNYTFEVTRRTATESVALARAITRFTGTYTLRVTDNIQSAPTISSVRVIPENDCCPVPRGKSTQFTADVRGGGNFSDTVIWRIDAVGDPRTNINSSGVLFVHQLEPLEQLTIRATSVQDTTRTHTFTIDVTNDESHYITLEHEDGKPIGGTLFGGGWHRKGCTEATIVATPGVDYNFVAWFEGTNKISDDASYTFTVDKDRTFEARFAERTTVTGIVISPLEDVIPVQRGTSFPFSAEVKGDNNPDQSAVIWTIKETNINEFTRIDENTGLLFIAPAEQPLDRTITVVATSTRDDKIFAEKIVIVTDEDFPRTVTAVNIAPIAPIVVRRGTERKFTASVEGFLSPQSVDWTVQGTPRGGVNTHGTGIDPVTGLLRIGATETRATITIRATSTHTNTIFREVVVTIPQPSVLSAAIAAVNIPARDNGVENSVSGLGLPLTVTISTTNGQRNDASVVWTVPATGYTPSTTTEQKFTVNGVVTLPEGVENRDPNPFSLSVVANVTVNAAGGGGGTGPGGGGDGPGGGGNTTTEPAVRTITFNLHGGTIPGITTATFTRQTQATAIFAAAQIPANPTRAGFTFSGWFTAATGGTQRNLATFVFTGNDTIHAQWTAIPNVIIGPGDTVPSDFAIPAATVNSVTGNLPFVRLRITAAGNQTVSLGAVTAGQNAILVRRNAAGELEVVTAVTIGNNGQATINVTAAGDYLVLARKTGDVTGTGAVDTGDALALLRHIAGVSGARLNQVQTFAANGRIGDVATGDALNILRLVANLITRIP
jgi:uncharacterized repeat protein (TIGR02543 family)